MAKIESSRWWSEPQGEASDCLIRVFRTVRDNAQWRVDADEYHAGLYAGGIASVGVKGLPSREYTYGPCVLPYNIARSATDTLVAKIAQHRPLPQVLTQRGNWRQQMRAKKMTQFIEGEFYRQKIFEQKAKLIVRDAAIFGRGILAIYEDGDEIVTDRAFPWEVFFDEWDARYGQPMTAYHLRSADREVLKEQWARTESGGWNRKVLDAIENATCLAPEINDRHDGRQTVDRVEFVEAYRLPSKKGGKGRHIVATSAGTLLDEEWELPHFPYAILFYNDPLTGMHGQGLVEQLEGYQYEINTMAQKVSDSHHLLGGAWVLVPQGSDIIETHLQNGLGTIVRHKPGGEVRIVQPNPVHPATYERLRDLPIDALNDVGISQMSAQSAKPKGITAAVALQTLDDIETERFIIFGRAYEAWCLDVARQLIACVKRIAERNGEYSVPLPMKGGLLDLKWADVEIDGFELRVFSTSLLPQQPSARLERLEAYFNAGVIDPHTFMKLLGSLDLEGEFELKMAPYDAVEERLQKMMETEEDADENEAYLAPSPYMPLEWAATRAQQHLDLGETRGMPEIVKALLRRFILDVEQMLHPPAPQPTGAELAGNVEPPGPPGAEPPMPPAPMPPGAEPPMPPM
ncbi:MAG: hypothetical protein C4308_14850, partial [Chitinophagaceae bacterium]